MFGTASQVRRWLLVEQDGPWGREALLESRLDGALARALRARARAAGVRLLLIRRHGTARGAGRTAFAACSTEQGGWVEQLDLAHAGDLLDVDLGALADGSSVGGRPFAGPLYLVCTNGRHDACCAEYGRTLARALSAARPQRTWECSHIGGDRFAGNLVCLPDGVYYGRVGPLDAARVASTHAAGAIDLAHYRGRCVYPFSVQAAEYFLRRERGLLDLHGLRLEAAHREDGGVRVVRFAHEGGASVVRVEVAADEARPLTCSTGPANPPTYRLLSLEPVASTRG